MRILLTLLITVACECRERLLEVQTLRSAMSQDRFVGLGTISIERTIEEELDLTEIIQDFASPKARKAYFLDINY